MNIFPDYFSNAVTVIADQGQPFILNCTIDNPNLSITWVQTDKKTGLYIVSEDSRIHFINNGYDLQFDYVVPSDEEYYICGVYDSNTGSFQTIKSYLLYVRSKLRKNIILSLT